MPSIKLTPPSVGAARPGDGAVAGIMRAVDCFAVCGLPASPVTLTGVMRGFVGAEERYRPEVLSSYSGAGNNDDVASVLSQLALMSMPEGVDVHIRDPPTDKMAPRTYPLVLTDLGGSLVHVMCLSFLEPVSGEARGKNPALRSACARKCLCLVSRQRTPLIVLRAILRAIHRTCFLRRQRDAPPLGNVVQSLVDSLPFPTRNTPPTLITVYGRPVVIPNANEDELEFDFFDAPDDTKGKQSTNKGAMSVIATEPPRWDETTSSHDYSGFEPLLRSLDPKNVARVICAAASEKQIVLRSRDNALLVSVGFAIVKALQLFTWKHAFIPLTPNALVKEKLTGGEPFIIGVSKTATLPSSVVENNNIIIVDLDTNDVLNASAVESGMPKRFTEQLCSDLAKLTGGRDVSDESVAVSGEIGSVEHYSDTNAFRLKQSAHRSAQNASQSGKRWSAAHDTATHQSFLHFWRKCFRGYRGFLNEFESTNDEEKRKKKGLADTHFDAPGFYRCMVSSKATETKEAAAFVRLVVGSQGFEEHAAAQVRNAARFKKHAMNEKSPVSSPLKNQSSPWSPAVDTVDVLNTDRVYNEPTALSQPKYQLFDPLLEEDFDETSHSVSGAQKSRGGGFFGAYAKEVDSSYLRSGTVVHAGWRRDALTRRDAREGNLPTHQSVSVTFRTKQLDLERGGGKASFTAGHGITPAAAHAGPSAHALAISGQTVGFPPRQPGYPRARLGGIDPPTVKAVGDNTTGSPTSPSGFGFDGGGLGFHSFGDDSLTALERRKKSLPSKSKSDKRNLSRSRSPEWIVGASVGRGRSASPPRAEIALRRASIDGFGVFSNPGSATTSPSELRRSVGGRFSTDGSGSDSDVRDTAKRVQNPHNSRSPKQKQSKTMFTNTFSIFSTRGRSHRKSEANPLLRLEQGREEQAREEDKRGGSARGGTIFGKKTRRAAQSVGSAQELAALRRSDGRASSVSAFDGWLAAAASEKPRPASSMGSSDRSESDDDRGVGSSDRNMAASSRGRHDHTSSTEVSPISSPDRNPARDGKRTSPGQNKSVVKTPVDVLTVSSPNTSQSSRALSTELFTTKLRELWALASADAAMPARATVAAAAIRAVCSPFAPGGASFAAAAAAELAAMDLHGVLLALEGGGAPELINSTHVPSPLLKTGVVLMSLEEEQGESVASPAPAFASPPTAPPTAAERKMKAAEAAVRAASAAADEAAARAGRAEEAAAIASTPGALAVVHAAAAAAAAAGDAGVLIRLLAVTRVVSSSSSFSEALAVDVSGVEIPSDDLEEQFDPAVATANGDAGRVLCRLPGGALIWGDARTWVGIESAKVAVTETSGHSKKNETSNDEWLFHPGVPPIRRRRALAACMSSTGLTPHAVLALLAQLGPPPELNGGGHKTRAGDNENANPDGKTKDASNRTENPSVNTMNTIKNRSSASRVGRSTAKLWNVVPSAQRGKMEPLEASLLGSGPAVAVAHDSFVENARAAAVSVGGSDAPWWALDENTRGVGRRKAYAFARNMDDDDAFDDDAFDDDADVSPSGAWMIRVGRERSRVYSTASLLPSDAVQVRLFSAPVTTVAAQLTSGTRGGLIAAGSASGAFAVWDPSVGTAARPAVGEWGAETSVSDTRRFAHSALTALCFLSDAGTEDESYESGLAWGKQTPSLVLGGTRGGGVAAWDVVKGACVLANPGSHAGAVTTAAAAPGGAGVSPGPAAGGAFGPTIALTASDAPGDGCVRLWDARTAPRRVVAALAGHVGGVTAVSPRWRLRTSGNAGGGTTAGRSGAFLTGDGSGVVRAWDWRRASGGALASAKAHTGSVTAVTPLDDSRTDVAGSAGEDGAVRAVVLDGGRGRGLGGLFGGGSGTLLGHLGPVRALTAIRGLDTVGANDDTSNGFDETNYDADSAGDSAADALTHRANGLGLVSGGDDGATRLWAPRGIGGSGSVTGMASQHSNGAWQCVGVGHAHGGAVTIVEAGASVWRGQRTNASVLTASSDNSVAAWSAPSPGGLGGWGGHGGGGGGCGRPSIYHSYSQNRNGTGFTTFASSRGDDFRCGAVSPGGPSERAENVIHGDDGFVTRAGAGWSCIRMHHRRTIDPPRALAVDPGGGRLISGMRDGSVSCAALPGWGE